MDVSILKRDGCPGYILVIKAQKLAEIINSPGINGYRSGN